MTKYNHKEAFCLMLYKCEKCGKVEQLWNSRDGVTPFIINCIDCGGEAIHIEWNSDRCVPDYRPYPGQRIFVNMTREKAEEIAKKRIKHYNKLGFNKFMAQEEILKEVTEGIWMEGKAPYIQIIE